MSGSLGSRAPVRVLVADEDPALRRLLAGALAALATIPTEIREAADLAGARARAGECGAAIVSLDGAPARDAIGALRRAGLAGPIIATSRNGSVSIAVDAMRAGADDFVVKPFRPAELARRLALALARSGGAAEPVPPSPAQAGQFAGFLGNSPVMQAVYDGIRRVAASKAPVFLTGESGTGKELCAQAIHVHSACAPRPMVALNCSAIPRELMESEIFGHVKGAFTGAHEDRPGAAELAHGGTLFLDEVCEMDLALQAKLLRFVQTGRLRRIGDGRERSVDVRFICATNSDPLAAVASGRFREDLFYRLHVLPLRLPPLRERAGDVLLLAREFLTRYAEEERRNFVGFDAEAEAALERHAWPGNVRELQNVIRRVVVLHDGERVSAAMLALPALGGTAPASEASRRRVCEIDPYWRQERKIIETALAAFGGNAARAAAALEISPSTIYRKLQAWAQGRASA
jgi:two-component system repressor protein LuxO